MSSYKDLMSGALRSFPTLYSEPLDVIVVMLGSSGNYEWGENGELSKTHEERDGGVMHFDDLDEDQQELDEAMSNPSDCLKSLNASRQLSLTAERNRRTLLDANMDTVVQGSCTETYFREAYHYGSLVREVIQAKGTFGTDTRFLYFPDNITPEWGEVVKDFHSWLDYRMNIEFGVSASGEKNHWPDHAQLLSQKINLARERLHPLVHDGESYDVYINRINVFASKMIDELLAEERAPQPAKARRPGV